jgi:hypothetical protein
MTSPLIGFGADQILSARIITAAGELIDVDDESHPDLLYALRGAGQFFGLVTQLTASDLLATEAAGARLERGVHLPS